MGRVAASDPEPGVLRAAGPEGTRAQNGKGRLTSGERERARTAVAPLGSERPPGCPRKEVRPLGKRCARGSEMLKSETKAGGADGHAPPNCRAARGSLRCAVNRCRGLPTWREDAARQRWGRVSRDGQSRHRRLRPGAFSYRCFLWCLPHLANAVCL